MAAPVAALNAGTPAGIKIDDGFSTKIAFDRGVNVSLWEKSVKPNGIDGGDKIDTTTMRNAAYRTFRSRSLITLTDSTFKCAYDPNVYNTIITSLVNQNGTITFFYPDGSTLALYGYLKSFEADDLVEGTQAEATVTVVATNFDPVNHVEAGPVLTSVAGT